MYGYQLRAEFEAVHRRHLAAQHRAGLHHPGPPGAGRPGALAAGERRGAAAVRDHRRRAGPRSPLWFATPISRADRPRDELAIKLALALTTPGVDVRGGGADPAHGDDARAAGVHPAQDPRATEPADLSWRLVLDAMIFQAEAEVRWLDHCEASLVRYRRPPPAPRRRRHPCRRPATDAPDRKPSEGAPMTPRCWNCATSTAPTAPARPRCTRCAESASRSARASWSP